MPFDIVDYQELATSRYTDLFKNDVVFDAIIKSIISPLQSYQIFLKDFHDSFLSIDNSFGKQLDIIGGLVGQTRILLNQSYFGFKGATNAQSFGTTTNLSVGGHWRSLLNPNNDPTETLNDETYRKTLKARIIKNRSKGSVNDFLAVMNILTGDSLTTVTTSTVSGTALVKLTEPVNSLTSYYLSKIKDADGLIPVPLGIKLVTT